MRSASIFIVLLTCFFSNSIGQNFWPSQVSRKPVIDSIIDVESPSISKVIDEVDRHRLQLIYTRIDRDSLNQPTLTHYGYQLDTTAYFYPASMVKLPTAAIALEKLNLIGKPGVHKFARISFEPVLSCQKFENEDLTSESGFPFIAHYVRKVFLVSDNPALDQLYDFVGRKHLNERLWNMGYGTARITNRSHPCTTNGESYGTAVNFFNKAGEVIYRQEPVLHEDSIKNPFGKQTVGDAHWTDDHKFHKTGWDFTNMSFISLWDLHQMVISIMMPEQVDPRKRFILRESDLEFMRRYMSMLPRESEFPEYDPEETQEGIVKYLLYGRGKQRIPSNIRIFNKVGMSFGFLTDCAYIVDYDAGVEFFLSAVVYVNDDETLNNNHYDYNTVGLPFLKRIGEVFLEYERKREKEFLPELERYH